ncbi:4-alpha-glucanotransferase [uncultured Gulosibacter sp.]|uniref:4-alpha-glucanotransferase n=1 Tax=uncultured Gulosibacter sp. TaxID=1339167 RepID=UPI00288A5992|nr:4-alpha-glucanotransferase [uncultured Gulosibacter sp.]
MTTTTPSTTLRQLAERYGVATSYHNWRGEFVEVSAETLKSVLAALDIDITDEHTLAAALRAADERPWRHGVPPTTMVRQGNIGEVAIHVPHGAAVETVALLESGETVALQQVENWREPARIDGVEVGEASFRIPDDLPLGWHKIRATMDGDAVVSDQAEVLGYRLEPDSQLVATGALIVVPERPATQLDAPVWGLMTQLYQLRSRRSWSVGDLVDLQTLGCWGAERDADFVLINPVHAPAPVTPITPSPYLPTTRQFIDPSILSVDAVIDEVVGAAGKSSLAEVVDTATLRQLNECTLRARLTNNSKTIDRDHGWLAKVEALWLLFTAAVRLDHDRWRAFGDFCEQEAEPLVSFATWCVLAEQFGSDWREWPEALQTPHSPEVDAFRQHHALRVQFYAWLQFEARRQSIATQNALRGAGMSIGVMRDLAVGVAGAGADAWALGPAMARGVTVGAPPDAFNQLGQNWGQPPLRPDSLYLQGYEPMRALLRNAFAGAGALRIDHILGFFRMWWVPDGASADAGTYVAYDYDAMLGVLLLEAGRAGALVVGEDLGVVSDLTREQMQQRHVYGTQIMWFERGEQGQPKPPEDYRVECLATVTTHDLPPTAGYLELAHVTLRDELGLYTRPVVEERAEEQAWVEAHIHALQQEGLVGDAPTTEQVVLGLHRRLASGAARMFGVSVADLAGDRRAINQPGTDSEYPNWRLPLSDASGATVGLEELTESAYADELARASRRSDALR